MHNNNARRGGGGGNRYNNNRTGGGGYNNRSPSSGGSGNGRPMNRNHSFDSVNPGGGRLRGTAQQLSEKYQDLARSAASGTDSTLAENLLQHAEHYARVNNEILEAMGFTPRDNNTVDSGEGAPPELTAYPPVQPPVPQMPAEQPSLGDFEPPEFLRARQQ